MRLIELEPFSVWMQGIKDRTTRFRITKYLDRVRRTEGLIGDYKSVGDRVIEVRLNFGPGYRLYVTLDRFDVVVLLIGGDKGSQRSDILKAKRIAQTYYSERDRGVNE